MKNYHPVNNYLLLVPAEEDEYKGIIYIPNQAKEKPNQGIVKSVGPMVVGDYRPGDEVVYSAHSEYRLDIDKQVIVLLVPETAIIMMKRETAAPETAPES